MLRVHTEVVALVVRYVLTAHDTFLTHISHRQRIGRNLVTTCDTQVVALHLSVALKHLVYPVGVIQIAVGVVNALHAAEVVWLVARVYLLLVHYGHILLRVQHLCLAGHVLPSVVSVEAHLSLAGTSVLGRHQYHTVGSLCTIDSSRCSILQHVDTLDVGRVQGRYVATYTIYKI